MPLSKADLENMKSSIRTAVLEGMNEHVTQAHTSDRQRLMDLESTANKAKGALGVVSLLSVIGGGLAAWAAFFRHS